MPGRRHGRPRTNGFDPQRSCATSTRALVGTECASGSWSPRRRRSSRTRRQVRRVGLQRPRPGADAARPRGRAATDRVVTASQHPHTIHFHGIHTSTDGRDPGLGAGDIAPGEPPPTSSTHAVRVHLYHCHSMPLAEHIAKGLYGAFIIDPKAGRPEADELVMVMNGFDTNFDRANEVYAVNTVAFEYLHRPVVVRRDQLVRIYLVNTLEFDLLNSFHIHANFFDYYPTGTARAARIHRHRRPGPGRARDPRAALPVHRQVHVPRPRARVRRARLDGLLRGDGLMAADRRAHSRRPPWLAGVAPLAGARRRDRAVRGARRARARTGSACPQRS